MGYFGRKMSKRNKYTLKEYFTLYPNETPLETRVVIFKAKKTQYTPDNKSTEPYDENFIKEVESYQTDKFKLETWHKIYQPSDKKGFRATRDYVQNKNILYT